MPARGLCGMIPDRPGGEHERGTAAALRDHRRRHGGHPERDQAPGGRLRRLHDLREGRPGRRHLAREHLPRPRLRRAVPPLHLLVRAQPGVEPPLLARPRDPGLLRAAWRSGTAWTAASASATRSRAARSSDGRWQLETEGRPARRGRRRDRRDRRAAPSEPPRHRGARPLRGRAVPQRALGSRRPARRAARRRHRHRLDRGADRLGARRPRGEALAVPAHRAVDHAAGEPGVHRGGEGRVPRRPETLPQLHAGPVAAVRGLLATRWSTRARRR